MTNGNGEKNPEEGVAADDADAASTAERRRRRLDELKVEASTRRAQDGSDDAGDPEDPQLQAFVAELAAKKNERKTQLALVKAFFTDPLRFSAGLKADAVTDERSIAHRRALIEDQIDLLSTILDAARTELEQLDKALERTEAGSDDPK